MNITKPYQKKLWSFSKDEKKHSTSIRNNNDINVIALVFGIRKSLIVGNKESIENTFTHSPFRLYYLHLLIVNLLYSPTTKWCTYHNKKQLHQYIDIAKKTGTVSNPARQSRHKTRSFILCTSKKSCHFKPIFSLV